MGTSAALELRRVMYYFVRWVIKVNWWRHVQGVRHNAALRISLNILCAMLNAAVPIQN